MRLWSVLFGSALLGPLPALAQSVEVQSTGLAYPTITEAIANSAIGGDTLVLDAGTYSEDVVVDRDLIVLGAGADQVTMVGGGGGSSIWTVQPGFDLTLEDVRFDSGSQRAIETIDDSLVTVTRVEFETGLLNNGGALLMQGSDLVLVDSTFVARRAVSDGGVIYASGSGLDTVDVINSTFTMGGHGASDGGAIYAVGVAVTCTDCAIDGGVASGQGGAIYASGDLTLIRGAISGSSAMDGGAVYVDGGALTIDGTSFTGNSATLEGGAVAASSADTVEIVGATFCGNTAAFGGAVDATSIAIARVSNAAFVENDAISGGALNLAGAGGWMLDNLTLLGNVSGTSGALRFDSTPGTVRSSLFAHNTGYAIDRAGTFDPTVIYDAFYNNSLGAAQNATLGAGGLYDVDPRLVSYVLDGDCGNDDLWPSPYSPLIDAGDPDPAYDDPDGSRNDIGVCGGPGAEASRHLVDADGDGVSLVGDCNDTNAAIFPGADELCNLADDDCNELVDDDPVDIVTWYPDADGDGFGDWSAGVSVVECTGPAAHVDNGTDCNDADPNIHPEVDEQCVSIDMNCDGDLYRGAIDARSWSVDLDGDGYGSAAAGEVACENPDPAAFTEIEATDCDDTSSLVHPGQTDTCNGIDDNCVDGELDAVDQITVYADVDGDGFGDPQLAFTACAAEPGYSVEGTDCDDAQALAFPGNPEVCDGLDNDCDGAVDDGSPVTLWWPDVDGDGHGAEGLEIEAFCPPEPTGWTQAEGGDCDDSDAAVYGGAPETCDGVDNDCDGMVDAADPDVLGTKAWVDFDRDGFGAGEPVITCDLEGYATQVGDCNDLDPTTNPAAEDVPGNDLDEDCDGRVLEGSGRGVEPPEDDPAGCACAHSSPAVGWMVPLLALAIARRPVRRGVAMRVIPFFVAAVGVFGCSGPEPSLSSTPAFVGARSDASTVLVEPLLSCSPNDDGPYELVEDTAYVSTEGLTGNDVGPGFDSSGLSVAIVSPPAHGALTILADYRFIYTPEEDYFGTDAFQYACVTASGLQSDTVATVTLSIVPEDDPPEAVEQVYAVTEDVVLAVPAPGLLGAGVDIDGDVITAALRDPPVNGFVVVRPNGSFEYTPDPGFSGPLDVFSYTVSDGNQTVGPALVIIEVLGMNDPPVAQPEAYTVLEDHVLSVSVADGLLANDTDEEGASLIALEIAGPAHGTLALRFDGSFDYTPDLDFHGVDTFAYQARDGELSSSLVEVVIDVVAINDAPIAVDDEYAWDPELGLDLGPLDGVLANDHDPDDDVLAVARVIKDATYGDLALEPDGALVYQPQPGFEGRDTFTYTVTDGRSVTLPALVEIDVTGNAGPDPEGDDPPCEPVVFLLDRDGDGFGDPALPVEACEEIEGLVATGGDCDDRDADVYPGARDVVLDGVDQDCSGADAVVEPVVSCASAPSDGGWWLVLLVSPLALRRKEVR